MTTVPRVRVGIVSWNTAGLLGECLSALPAALQGLDASIVVVDNASEDDSVAVALEAGVEVRQNTTNVGYARAMNHALSGSKADVLIALNPDTRPPPGSLAALVTRLLAYKEVGLVAPRLVNFNGSLQHSAYTFPSVLQAAAVSFLPARARRGAIGRRLWLEGAAPHDQSCDVEWVIGAVHVIKTEALPDPDRPYSERWFMYVEDLDLCWRLASAGWRRRLEADISVPHFGGASAVQLRDSPRRQWTPLSYDWYAEAHGMAAMRLWALVNTAGTAWVAFRTLTGSLVRRQPEKRREAREWARHVPMHAKAVLHRPL